MTHVSLKLLFIATALTFLASPLAAQNMSAAQCDQMMMLGTQNYSPAEVAGCAAYFQSLADRAVAPGTFSTPTPRVGVVLATSGG